MFELKLENEYQGVIDINDADKYRVLSISGLNPPSASIFTSKSPNRKGSKYNGSTLNERILVIEIEILGEIEQNRNALYSWVDTEQYVKVLYKNNVKDVYCEGHIQDCEVDLFSEKEVIKISVLCENPYWITRNIISVDLLAVIKQFVLPFSINVEGIPFSSLAPSTRATITNNGIETGARFIIQCNDDVNGFTLFDGQDASKQFVIDTTLEKDWIVIIDTDSSPKTVKAYKPDGTIINLLKYIKNPTWFTIKRGTNIFEYTAASGIENVVMTISYQDKCLGV